MSFVRFFLFLLIPIFSSFFQHSIAKSITSTSTQICAIEKYSQTISCFGPFNDTIIPDDSLQFESISSAFFSSCGITATERKILCWKKGHFWHKTFGNETGFTKVATGENHVCGLKNQQLTCAGRDDYGQASPPPGNFIDVSAGRDSTCAINTNGEIQCFGKGYENYVGTFEMFGLFDGSTPNGTFVEVSVGSATQACALSTTGDIHCWGLEKFFNENLVLEGPFIHVHVHFYGICGIRTNHTVECWRKRLVFYHLSSSVLFSEVSVGIDNACGVENGTNLLKCESTGPHTNKLSIPNDFEVYMDQ